MIKKLKLLLQQQMDGVLERIDEDEGVESEEEENGQGKKSSAKKKPEEDDTGKASVGKGDKNIVEPFDLGSSPK